jgi:phage replication O-like protein O
MANPQVEDGYVKIANEVLDRIISTSLGGAEYSCVMLIIRQSWGWGKKEAEISQKQFVEKTARDVDSIRGALSSLQKKRIIAQVAPPAFDRAATWRIEKNWELWENRGRASGGAGKTPTPPKKHQSSEKTPVLRKNPTLEGGKNPTPPLGKTPTPALKNELQIEILQADTPARKLQKYNLKTIKEIKTGVDTKAVDVRLVPLRDFFFAEYEKLRGHRYRISGSDINELKRLLRDTRGQDGFELDKLKAASHRFLSSNDPFHLKQGRPLGYFCANVNAFMQARGAPKDRVGEASDKTREECILFLESQDELSEQQKETLKRLKSERKGAS